MDKRLVKRALAGLRRAAPGLLGIVFNAVELKSGQHHYYYYRTEDRAAAPPKAAAAKTARAANRT